jgi:hypothetical protein
MRKTFNPFRAEEVPIVAEFTHASVTRPVDAADFLDFSPDYSVAFFGTFNDKIRAAVSLLNMHVRLAELKVITEKLYGDAYSLRPKLLRLGGYIDRARAGLTVGPKDFRLKEIRKYIGKNDMEKLLEELGILLSLLDVVTNMNALKAKGFKDADRAALVTLEQIIRQGNVTQNLKLDEKEALVQANKQFLLELWDMTADVLDAGKRIYKYTDKEKINDYTAARLLKRIRHEFSPKKKEEEGVKMGILAGTMTLKSTGEPIEEGTIEVVETKDVEVTDVDGEYAVDVKVGTVTVKATAEGCLEQTVMNVVINPDVTTDLDFEMEAPPAE